jgi:S-adenosylmethionine:tRNA ribosyltransferase-isomerase
MYKLKDYDYDLPAELIATEPAKKRDHSRLLVLDKKSGKMEHKHFYDIVDYLQAGDVLVMNNSKVIPARLIGKKQGSGGRVEVFLHKKNVGTRRAAYPRTVWEVLIGAKNIKPDQVIEFEKNLIATVIKNNEDGTWQVAFNYPENEFIKIIEEIGEVPLPPYIKKEKRKEVNDDKRSYQTVYADDSKPGSVAAPTAGLHFNEELLQKLKTKGVETEYITLHVGLGTFAPVKTDDIRKHKMHEEYVEIEATTIEHIISAKREGRRMIAVGTTSARTLEALAEILDFRLQKLNLKSKICDFSGWVNIFIYPGYEFKVVDAMITNFHLPKSSLIMLVSALAGKDNIDNAYREAIKEKYRFYSYGDGMFIY